MKFIDTSELSPEQKRLVEKARLDDLQSGKIYNELREDMRRTSIRYERD
ncbi:MAG: hypothetical protein ACREAN_03895 [Nitrosopumilaceae archaeon]